MTTPDGHPDTVILRENEHGSHKDFVLFQQWFITVDLAECCRRSRLYL